MIILLLNEVLYFHFLSDLSNTKTTILVSVQVHSARDQYLNATCRDISTNIHYSFEEWLDTNTLTNFFANLVPPESFQPITESLRTLYYCKATDNVGIWDFLKALKQYMKLIS